MRCAPHVVSQGSSLVVLTGHTHRHGEHFWVTDPSGASIYENFNYNDPLYKEFEPWLTFDAPVEAGRPRATVRATRARSLAA